MFQTLKNIYANVIGNDCIKYLPLFEMKKIDQMSKNKVDLKSKRHKYPATRRHAFSVSVMFINRDNQF